MRIKVLVENTASAGFCGEHGLCLYVEYKGKYYLMDSGASGLFAENADKLAVDLGKVDKAFLSHAHYDHSGGYAEFFARNNHAKVYLQQSAKGRDFYKIAEPVHKYIGIPEGLLDQYSDRFQYVDGAATIDDWIHIVPHSAPGILERAKRTHMCVIADGQTSLDDFSHEQTVVFEEEDGLVCFNSCSHAGVDLIVGEVSQAFPGRKIKAYIGGFHMMGIDGVLSCGYSKEEVQTVAKKLRKLPDIQFYSGHCTGQIAFDWLGEILHGRLTALKTGMAFDV